MSARKVIATGGGGLNGSAGTGGNDDHKAPVSSTTKQTKSLACDARPPTLEALRALNRERWRTVELLHSRLNDDGGDDHDVDGPNEDPLELQASYLRAEIRLLREREELRSRGAGEVARRIGDALSRPAEIHGIEIAETHGALLEANAALDRSIGVGGDGEGGRLGERIRVMRGFAAQHRAIHSALIRMLGDAEAAEPGSGEAGAGTGTATEGSPAIGVAPSAGDGDRDELERKWVLGEFEYLASILDAENRRRRERRREEEEAALEGQDPKGGDANLALQSGRPNTVMGDSVVAVGPLAAASPRGRKRRRPADRGGVPPASSPPSESASMSGAIGPLLRRLSRRLVCHRLGGDGDDDETDPYVSIAHRSIRECRPGREEDEDGVAGGGAAAAEASVTRLLVKSGVAETHPDDDTLVRLVDLLE